MPKFVLAAAVWLFKPSPTRPAGTTAGWLGRHSSRAVRAPGAHGPYVDLGPLDLTRRR